VNCLAYGATLAKEGLACQCCTAKPPFEVPEEYGEQIERGGTHV